MYNEYNTKFVYPKIFVRKYDKAVSTETDTNDLDYYPYQDDDRSSVTFTPERKQRNFQHLTVPASSLGQRSVATSSVRYRRSSPLSSGLRQRSSRSTSTSPVRSEEENEDDEDVDEQENDDDEEEEEEEEEEDDDEEDSSSGDGLEVDEEDPDVDYDEEGEEPVRPHPTNSLSFRNK